MEYTRKETSNIPKNILKYQNLKNMIYFIPKISRK